jgi:putative ABC transport system permease protein
MAPSSTPRISGGRARRSRIRVGRMVRIYRNRLRVRAVLVQELLAVLGLAVGVALLFSSQVASESLNKSVSELSSGLVGNMQLQLQARGPGGFDAGLLGTVRKIPGVAQALPVLEQQATIIGPRGRASVELLGADAQFAHATGPLRKHFTVEQLEHQQALALPAPIAGAIGAESLVPIEVQVGTHVTSTSMGATLHQGDIGALVNSPVAMAPVAYAGALAGNPGRLTRIFVRAKPGREAQVRAALVALAAGRLNVFPADFDSTQFDKAAAPTNEVAALFAGISAVVGFLFAFNALLITAQLRRNLIRDLRRSGATRARTIGVVLLDALILGVLGCGLGLVLGDVASVTLFHSTPGYLSYAFPVGSERVVTFKSVAIAVAAGMLAALIGVLAPLRGELARPLRRSSRNERSERSGSAANDGSRGRPGGRARIGGGLVCLGATTLILALDPALAILGAVLLTIAMLLLLESLLDGVIAVFARAARRRRSATASAPAFLRSARRAHRAAMGLAARELRAPATRTRSLAIAATGAVAVFGSVAIGGAHGNLQSGLDRTATDMNRVSAIWVSAGGAANTLGTTPFDSSSAARLQKLAGVRSVAIYRGGFLALGDRLVWVIAPPASSPSPIPSSQLLEGNLALANARLRAGGWAVISQAIADERHLQIGDSFVLPSPVGTSFRIAALSTNVGWPPGAVIVNASDYAKAWGSAEASAYNIDVQPGNSASTVSAEVRRALGGDSGLSVQTARQREGEWRASSRQGLSRLSQIALLVLIAAAVAMAGAMAAMIWQRRSGLAYLKRQGYRRSVLWQALLYESAVLLGASCSIGAVFGLYGQVLGSHYLASVTGFPIVFSLDLLVALESVALVSLAAGAIVAVLGYAAAGVPPRFNPG